MPLVATAHLQVISRDEEWGDGTLCGRRLRFVARLSRRDSQTSLPWGLPEKRHFPQDGHLFGPNR